jgi:catechol 2,3-dioxygenase-like lactoylglutathione lyase family enzyme
VIDHVTLRVSDFEASKAFYEIVLAPLGYAAPWSDDEQRAADWGDLSISQDEKPLTKDAHLAFAARTRAEVDEFHEVALAAGYRDNGPPGERREYHDGYYGAFVLDPDGNNVEAVHHGIEPTHPFDHAFLRVSDLDASRAFYDTVLAPLDQGVWASGDEPDGEQWVALGARGNSIWLVEGKPLTENLHVAFTAKSRDEVDAFHRAAVEAGYPDNGPPGERPIYHEGYYGAFVLDPEGNNVEAVFHDRS